MTLDQPIDDGVNCERVVAEQFVHDFQSGFGRFDGLSVQGGRQNLAEADDPVVLELDDDGLLLVEVAGARWRSENGDGWSVCGK